MPAKIKFIETAHCLGRGHCYICRNRIDGRQWRAVVASAFEVPDNKVDFECPFKMAWTETAQTTTERPMPTLKKVVTFLEAMVKAGKVPEETRLERVSTCLKCEFFRKSEKGEHWCGACGCKFSAEDRTLTNLAAYKEGRIRKGLPRWGCRYPQRFTATGEWTGKGWKA